ncbi:MAG: hypothetical protein ACI8PT_003495, partial [Gammaproteobacteria bacterium]
KGLPRNTPPKTEGVDGCCQQGARSENTPVFDRRATPLAVPSSSRIGRVISRQILNIVLPGQISTWPETSSNELSLGIHLLQRCLAAVSEPCLRRGPEKARTEQYAYRVRVIFGQSASAPAATADRPIAAAQCASEPNSGCQHHNRRVR